MELGEQRVRIIGGMWRGRPLVAPKGRDTRPTTDRVREAIFSSIYSLLGDLHDAVVVDLYAGSGALGLEALSRGAGAVAFVESDRDAARAIAQNLKALGVKRDAGRIVQAKVQVALGERLGSVGASLLLADPPYRIEPSEFCRVLEGLASTGVLRPGALVVYEHSAVVEALWPSGFVSRQERRYGDTAVSFATYEGDLAQ